MKYIIKLKAVHRIGICRVSVVHKLCTHIILLELWWIEISNLQQCLH